jgi:hypothetical protein
MTPSCPGGAASPCAAIRNLAFERVIDAGHNNIYERPAFAAAMQEALARIEAA